MPFRFSSLVFLAALVLLVSRAGADTFILKNGEKIEGKAIGETDVEYTIEYQAAAGITDTRTVPKNEVERIEKINTEEIAFQSLRNVKPAANSLPVTGYEPLITALQFFLTQYPQSPHAEEIKAAVTAITEEKERVAQGEVKLDGKWISAEEVKKEAYQINGRAVFAYMQEQARRGDLLGALNTFERLEKTYPGSTVYPDAVPVARQILERLKSQAEQMLQNWKFEKAQRDTATAYMSEPQRGLTIAAQKREQQQLDDALTAANSSGAKWPALQKHERTLTAIIAKIPNEIRRLDTQQVAKMRQSLQYLAQARTQIEQEKLDDALASLKEATKLWSANELALRLQKDVSARKMVLARATPKPVTTPTPTPASIATTAGKVADIFSKDESKPFLSTPRGMGIIAVGVVGLLVGYFTYKKKKRAAEANFH